MSQEEPEEIVKFVLRLNPKLHKAVKKSAKEDQISMNKKIVFCLQYMMTTNQNFTVRKLMERMEEDGLLTPVKPKKKAVKKKPNAKKKR